MSRPLLNAWLEGEKNWGQLYLEYQPLTPGDRLYVEDLAVTMLINPGSPARRRSASIETPTRSILLPSRESTRGDHRGRAGTCRERDRHDDELAVGGASLATKTLHKKRPALILVLDNQAIFGAYMNPLWPEKPSLAETIKAPARIKEALDWIATDLARAENAAAWTALEQLQPTCTRIELFDMIWWGYLRG